MCTLRRARESPHGINPIRSHVTGDLGLYKSIAYCAGRYGDQMTKSSSRVRWMGISGLLNRRRQRAVGFRHARAYRTVNGAPGKGGSLDGDSQVVAFARRGRPRKARRNCSKRFRRFHNLRSSPLSNRLWRNHPHIPSSHPLTLCDHRLTPSSRLVKSDVRCVDSGLGNQAIFFVSARVAASLISVSLALPAFARRVSRALGSARAARPTFAQYSRNQVCRYFGNTQVVHRRAPCYPSDAKMRCVAY
jgi:hypothetical protein